MRNYSLKYCVAVLFLLLLPFSVKGQEDVSTSPVNVFIDGSIDENYLKEEFPQVNYVRTKESSNVHLLATRQSTGAGMHYQLFFIGYGEFAGKNDTLSYYSNSQATSTEIRDGYTRVIEAGLIRYLALADTYYDLNIPDSDDQRGGNSVVEDPWDSWVFDIRLNGNMGGEESKKSQSFSSGLDVSRVTNDWRFEFSFDYESEKKIYDYDDYYSENITLETRGKYSVVKSLGPHAGTGIIGELQSNTVDNYDINSVNALAIEYNFFPYDMSSRRQLYVNYFIGVDYRDYTDSTVYDKLYETIPYERFSIGYSQREQWGNVSANISFQNFLNDFSKNHLRLSSGINLRIWRGLSWNLNASYSLINDDVNIAKTEVDPEDILLGLRQLSTSSSYSIRTGISFTFGSMYNNIVNTRLRQGSSGGSGGSGGSSGGGGGRY